MGQQDSDPIVQVSHVYLDYNNGRNQGATIVEDANFSIQRGGKFVIIGPSAMGGPVWLCNVLIRFMVRILPVCAKSRVLGKFRSNCELVHCFVRQKLIFF